MSKILSLEHISKQYPGVRALSDVSLSFETGEIHAIMGENGAGKSTLIKIIAGAVKSDGGTVTVGDRQITNMTPSLARECGIGVIYQEFNLVPSLSVARNICLGDRVGGKFLPDFKQMREKAAAIFQELGVDIDPDTQVSELSTAKQQLVEIAKAMAKDVKILIMDEPSAALAMAEVENMLKIVMHLKERGVTILYISHRMDEVFRIADRVSVLRDGCYVDTRTREKSSRRELINRMVGREFSEEFPPREVKPGPEVLKVENLSGNGDRDINFTLHKGEILGLAGLVGAGRTELAQVIYGCARKTGGRILINGEEVDIRNPGQAVAHGIGLIPEDRKREGVFLEYSVRWNIPIMSMKRLSRFTVVNQKQVDEVVEHYTSLLKIKTPDMDQLVRNLSGGNQQKVVLAKTLAAQTEILIFDEPTRGIDVGAKQEIYHLMNDLVSQGISIIMISSEMEELIGMSDRILVLYEGRMTGEIRKEEFSQKRIMELASGL